MSAPDPNQPKPRSNQYLPLPPDGLFPIVCTIGALGLNNRKVVEHALDHFDHLLYGLRELGYKFAEGNIPETFKSFETNHMCNNFCKMFGLLSDYENCVIATY
ncbi:hypothetical protein BYT27DRAFT_7215853 [Phlegmacium glaucopus]|nr:hypothetical protein BYT27DRAFT_7215853 [Phlegmacium glaucopus]